MPIISALLVVALSVALSLELFASIDLSARLTGNQAIQAQQQWALRASLEVAQTRLLANLLISGVDAPDQAWALDIDDTTWVRYAGIGVADPLSRMHVYQHIEDEQAKLNLSDLVTTPSNLNAQAYLEPQMLAAYRRLLIELRLDPILASRAGDEMLIQARAKAHDVACCAPGRLPLDNFDSLQTVPGYVPDVLDRLRPYVTILPGATPVNVNTTTPVVLSAVIKGLSPAQAAAVLSGRRANHFVSLGDFSTRLSAAGFSEELDTSLLGIHSSYFTVLTRVRDGHAERTSESWLRRISTAIIIDRTQRIE